MATERTLDLNKMKEVHKELHNKIYGCKCNPSLEPWMYCKQCQNTVIEFMNNYGAGVLCRDIEVDTLQKELSKTKISLVSIEKKFESKCKDYENLKNKQKQTNQNIIKLREELKSRTTKEQPLDFNREPLELDEEGYPKTPLEYAYCGGCDRFVIEEGCTCGLVDIKDIDELFNQIFPQIEEGLTNDK